VLLRNLGTAATTLTAITLSPASEFSETDNCNAAIAAGSYCTVNLAFTPSTAGIRTGTMTVSSNSGVLATVTLSGTGIDSPVVITTPQALSFGTLTAGTLSAPQIVTLSNIGNSPTYLDALEVTPNAPFTMQTSCGTSLQPGQSCQASIVFGPIVAGEFTANLSAYVSGQGYVNVSLIGEAVLSGAGGTGALIFSPSSVNFNNQLVGTASPAAAVTFVDSGVVPVTVNSITATLTSAQGAAGDFAASYECGNLPAEIQAQSSCPISITFTPSAAATESATISVATSESTTPLTFTVSGIGIAAAQTLEFEPGNLSFPDQPMGVVSGVQWFYVYATGTAPVSIDRALISGNFQISSQGCAGTTLTPRRGSPADIAVWG